MAESLDMEFSSLVDVDLESSATRFQRQQPEERDPLPSPMSLLLPEILSMIFFVYAEDNLELFNLKWTRILLVCRHWYDVAVRTPALWSYVELRDVPPTQPDAHEVDAQDIWRTNMQRSRAGHWPLTMSMNFFFLNMSEPKQADLATFWDSSSLFSLTIHGNRDSLHTALQILQAQRRDTLEHLIIRDFQGRLSVLSEALSLSGIILRDHSPQLRSLSIDGLLLDWGGIQSLQILRAVYGEGWRGISLSLSEILDALIRCPLLEHLQITLPRTFRPGAVIPPGNLTLLRIKSIHLKGSDEFCGRLLHALPDLPSTTKVFISTTIDYSYPEPPFTPPSSISYFRDYTSRIDAPVIRVISLVRQPYSDHGLDIQFSLMGDVDLHLPMNDPQWSKTGRPDAASYVGAAATIPPRSEVDLLHHIIRQWPVGQVTHLDVRRGSTIFWRIDHGLWRALFMSLPTVMTVIMETSAMDILFDILDTHLQENGRRIVNSVILDLTFAASVLRFEVEEGPEAFAPYIMRRVLSYCADAARANVPLDTVEVINDVEGYFSVVDCNDYCKNLARGFVYRGTLYTATTGNENA